MKSPTIRSLPFLLAAMASLTPLAPSSADDWFVKGRAYHNVQVLRVNPDTVSVNYDGGTGRLALADLPPDIAQRLAADAKKAQSFAIIKQEAATDLIDHLIVSLTPMHGLWVNGAQREINLPSTAAPDAVLTATGCVTPPKILEVRAVQIDGDAYTAVRATMDGTENIVLLRYLAGGPNGGNWSYKIFPSGY